MKTVIEMAREAEHLVIEDYYTNGPVRAFSEAQLERFAELVRKDYSFTHAQMWLKRFDDAILAERKAMMQLFTDPENQPTQYGTVTVEYTNRELSMMEEHCAELILAEREACAKVCDELDAMNWSEAGEYSSGYGDEIRKRGTQ